MTIRFRVRMVWKADFYQMYAYGSAGTKHYSDIVLLYPTTEPLVRRTFYQKDQSLQLHVRQFDPRDIYNRESKTLDAVEMIQQLNEAFADVQVSA